MGWEHDPINGTNGPNPITYAELLNFADQLALTAGRGDPASLTALIALQTAATAQLAAVRSTRLAAIYDYINSSATPNELWAALKALWYQNTNGAVLQAQAVVNAAALAAGS
jgi:hypothetical protein